MDTPPTVSAPSPPGAGLSRRHRLCSPCGAMSDPTLTLDLSPPCLDALREALRLPAAVGLKIAHRGVVLTSDEGPRRRIEVNGRRLGRGPRLLIDGDTLRYAGVARRLQLSPPDPALPPLEPGADPSTRALALAGLRAPERLWELGPHLLLVSGAALGQRWPLSAGETEIGRGPRADLRLHDFRVSREHAALSLDAAGRATLRDLKSRHGVYLNGRRIRARALKSGDEFTLGPVTLRYLCPRAQDPLPPSAAPQAQAPLPAPAPAPWALVFAALLVGAGVATALMSLSR